jgi:hypothetical protein
LAFLFSAVISSLTSLYALVIAFFCSAVGLAGKGKSVIGAAKSLVLEIIFSFIFSSKFFLFSLASTSLRKSEIAFSTLALSLADFSSLSVVLSQLSVMPLSFLNLA